MKKNNLLILSMVMGTTAYAAQMDFNKLPESARPSTQLTSYMLQNAGSIASDIIANLNTVQTVNETIIPVIEAIQQSRIARDSQNNVAKTIQQYKAYITSKANFASTGGRGTSRVMVKPDYQQTKASLSADELAVYNQVESAATKLQKMFPLMGGVSKIVTDFLDLAYRASTTVPPYSNIQPGQPLPQ